MFITNKACHEQPSQTQKIGPGMPSHVPAYIWPGKLPTSTSRLWQPNLKRAKAPNQAEATGGQPFEGFCDPTIRKDYIQCPPQRLKMEKSASCSGGGLLMQTSERASQQYSQKGLINRIICNTLPTVHTFVCKKKKRGNQLLRPCRDEVTMHI